MLSIILGLFNNNKLISIVLITLIISSLFVYTYYSGYSTGKEKAEKVINENYIELIKNKEKENQEKFKTESNKYLESINKNEELKKELNKKQKELLNLKSESLKNKDCKLIEDDIKKINNFIELGN